MNAAAALNVVTATLLRSMTGGSNWNSAMSWKRPARGHGSYGGMPGWRKRRVRPNVHLRASHSNDRKKRCKNFRLVPSRPDGLPSEVVDLARLRPIASTACKRIGGALVAAEVCACIMSNVSPLRLALLFAWRAVERARRALKVILAPPSRRGKRVIPGHQGRPGHQGHKGRRGLRERKVLLGRLALRRQSQVTAPSV